LLILYIVANLTSGGLNQIKTLRLGDNMFELLKRYSWELNIEELKEKRNQVRKLMWIYFIMYAVLFFIGTITWMGTNQVVLPVYLFVLSIYMLMLIAILKINEGQLTIIICNKKP